MVKCEKTEIAKKSFMLQKKLIKNWNVNFDDIVISKLVQM